MGFLFGRKGRNETHGRRSEIAKKSASVLAAVAVAGGSVTVGVPEAEADMGEMIMFFRKMDESGELLGGSKWKLEYYELADIGQSKELTRHVIYVEDRLTQEKFDELGLWSEEHQEAYIREHFGEYETPSREYYGDDTPGHTDMFDGVDLYSSATEVQLRADLAFLEGEIAVSGFGPYKYGRDYERQGLWGGTFYIDATPIVFTELSSPIGYTSCDGSGTTSATYHDGVVGVEIVDDVMERVLYEPKTVLDSLGRVRIIDQDLEDQIYYEFTLEEEDKAGRFDHVRYGSQVIDVSRFYQLQAPRNDHRHRNGNRNAGAVDDHRYAANHDRNAAVYRDHHRHPSGDDRD
jgi:hypothetical protein